MDEDLDTRRRHRRFNDRPHTASYSRLTTALAGDRGRDAGRSAFDELVRLVEKVAQGEMEGHEAELHQTKK